jgi:hypothetical protein
MPSEEVLVMVTPSVSALMPKDLVAQLALKAPPQLDEGGRVGPCQEDWALDDGGVNQCNDKVGCIGVPSGGDIQW